MKNNASNNKKKGSPAHLFMLLLLAIPLLVYGRPVLPAVGILALLMIVVWAFDFIIKRRALRKKSKQQKNFKFPTP